MAMFNVFTRLVKKVTPEKQPHPAQAQTVSVSPGNTFLRNEEGFWIPQNAGVLLSTPTRQRWLQQIAPVVALPDKEYRTLCLSPLKRLAESLQCVPAGRTGHYQGEGGLLDLTLQTTAWCVRMSQKEMLPRGVPAEEQSRQFSAWNVCVFYTGLLYWLPLTSLFEGQLDTLRPWYPGLGLPAVPFRFRFHDVAPDINRMRQTQGALKAIRLLPAEAVDWLSGYPRALQALTEVVTGQANADNDLMRILNEALGAFEPGSLPDITPVADTLFPGETDRTVSDINAPGQSEPISAVSSPQFGPSGQGGATALLTPLAPAEAPEAVSHSVVDFQLASPDGVEPQIASESPDVTMPIDKLIPPSDDLMYALELSGIVPMELSDVPDKLKNNDEETSLPSMTQPITAPVHISNVQMENHPHADAEGKYFWAWLKEGLLNGKIENNTADAKVHSVAGYLFCQSPAIFFQYAQEHHKNTDDINNLISSFESLNFHRVIRRPAKQTGHFRARLYGEKLNPLADNEELVKLPHKKVSGYLIKGSRIFGMNMPEESLFIRIVGH